MAIMCPCEIKEFNKNSLEDLMYECLKNLPDDYYVFHSFKIVNVSNDNIIYESEADFVIFNPKKGILCIEAKAGNVKYENGKWYYGSGIPMSHDGPYRQAESIKWKLSKLFEEKNCKYLLEKCKLLHSVWFPSISKSSFSGINLPSEADIKLMLTRDSFENITEEIEKIFSINLPNLLETSLDNNEEKIIINKILAPSFNLVSLPKIKIDNNKQIFARMINEQIALLNYLEEQDNAVISGMAGTGKTVMAIEKAKRHANNNEKVLVLCYNSKLRDYLKLEYSNEYIEVNNIDEFACNMCDTLTADYELLEEKLIETMVENTFPYKHVIIDEGQDFGRDEIHEHHIVDLLKSNVLDNENQKGSFYLFYDKNQLIQAEIMPKYITESDCKLTLYQNCRNTINIAQTSLRLLGSDKKPRIINTSVLGESVEMYFEENTENTIKTLDKIIEDYKNEGYSNIQILTCSTLKNSIIASYITDEEYKNIPVSTCRKFKGLEADAIILLDINMNVFDNNMQIMYVGASRARYKLTLLSNLSDDDCTDILNRINEKVSKNPRKKLATSFSTKLREI